MPRHHNILPLLVLMLGGYAFGIIDNEYPVYKYPRRVVPSARPSCQQLLKKDRRRIRRCTRLIKTKNWVKSNRDICTQVEPTILSAPANTVKKNQVLQKSARKQGVTRVQKPLINNLGTV